MSYEDRKTIFHRRRDEVDAHNARNVSWRVAVNRFSDYSEAELKAMLGYKRVGGRWAGFYGSAPAGASSFIQEKEDINTELDNSDLEQEVDWRGHLSKTANWVRNQGACGSCWAVAAVGALEMHAEKVLGSSRRLSHQQLVDCTANPHHCGGTGGCSGATAELAFEHARRHGIRADEEYLSDAGGKCNEVAAPVLKVDHFVSLPINKGSYLLRALAQEGPVVVSVDGGNWYNYASGVFSGCQPDTVVNHATLAVGYGIDRQAGKKYWTIRNSWGADWGDNGFIKIERHSNDRDYCGMDNKPQEGVFCDGAPKEVEVCGMCGITSDSAYPGLTPKQSSSLAQRHSSSTTKKKHERMRLKLAAEQYAVDDHSHFIKGSRHHDHNFSKK